jgi:hypothetical protein
MNIERFQQQESFGLADAYYATKWASLHEVGMGILPHCPITQISCIKTDTRAAQATSLSRVFA